MSFADREDFGRLYWAHRRARLLAAFAGLGIGFEAVNRLAYFRGMASGWRLLSMAGVAFAARAGFNMWNATTYGPLIGAYLRKYDQCASADAFEITDRKREYYHIDDSQYMNYTEADLTDHRHVSHGPQPDGLAKDSTWLEELDKFLAGKENHLKDHPRYLKYDYQFIDKSFPTQEMANDLITKQ